MKIGSSNRRRGRACENFRTLKIHTAINWVVKVVKFPATPSLPLSLPPSLTLAELGGDPSVSRGRNYFTRMTEGVGSVLSPLRRRDARWRTECISEIRAAFSIFCSKPYRITPTLGRFWLKMTVNNLWADIEFVLRNSSIFREFFLPCMWFLSFQASFRLHFHCACRWELAWKWKEPHTGKKEWSEYATIAEHKFYVWLYSEV